MSFRLELRSAASADLQEAFTWYEARQNGLGLEFIQAVESKLAQIESNPLQFPVIRHVTRRATLIRFPYGIFYVLRDGLIVVTAVMHHARKPLRWQRRT